VKREVRNELIWTGVIAAVIVPLVFVPALHRPLTPLFNVLQVIASVVDVLILLGFVLLVAALVWARLWWRRMDRRAAREAGRWWEVPEERGRQDRSEVVDEEVGG
jgi:hypothetical protein